MYPLIYFTTELGTLPHAGDAQSGSLGAKSSHSRNLANSMTFPSATINRPVARLSQPDHLRGTSTRCDPRDAHDGVSIGNDSHSHRSAIISEISCALPNNNSNVRRFGSSHKSTLNTSKTIIRYALTSSATPVIIGPRITEVIRNSERKDYCLMQTSRASD